ncbi:MAG: DUF1501 domain-containing protein [Proteobacteria bacterium]|nr:DUF1501 domain-containing protein [Pseudomonadota bacterium]
MKTPDFTRREFVKGLSAATLGALGAGYPRALAAAEDAALRPPATADTIIVLWMGGGMASTETFDPKRYTPYEKGTSSTGTPAMRRPSRSPARTSEP